MSFKKTFFKNISSFAIYRYISQGLEFLSTIILSRLLLPEEYGFVAIILVFSGFVQLFSDVGLGASVVRSDYGYTFHRHLYSLSVWLGMFLALIMMGMAYPIAYFFDNEALILPTILISLRFIFDAFTYIPYAILSKKLMFKSIGIANLFGTGFQIIFTIILAALGFSYWSLIFPLVLGPLFQLIYLRRKVKIPFRLYGIRATLRTMRKIRSLMGHLTISKLVSYWSGNADKVIVGRFYSEADLGLYNRAFRFIMIATKLITGIFSIVLLPSLKKLLTENGDANKEYLDILKIITLFNMPVILILLLFPSELVLILWGKKWQGVSVFLPYIAIILLFKSMLQTTSPVYILYRKERNMTIVNFVNSALTIALVLIGGLFSIMHIISFITLGIIVISLPLHIFFGFYKSFGFRKGVLVKFWVPVMLIGLGLFTSVHFDNYTLRIILLVGYNFMLIFSLRNTISEFLQYGLNMLMKKNKNTDTNMEDS